MNFFKNLGIRKKLVVSHGLIALMALAVAIFGLGGIQLSSYRLADLQEGPMTATDAICSTFFKVIKPSAISK